MQGLRRAEASDAVALTMSVIVCAYNEGRLHPALPRLAAFADPAPRTRSSSSTTPAPTDTAAISASDGVTVVDEPTQRPGACTRHRPEDIGDGRRARLSRCGLPRARSPGSSGSSGGAGAATAVWRSRGRTGSTTGTVGPRADWRVRPDVAPLTHVVASASFGAGALLLRRQFRREARRRWSPSAASTNESSSTARTRTSDAALSAIGHVAMSDACWLHTSARRYRALGTWKVMFVCTPEISGPRRCITSRRTGNIWT